jgi:hypothetical protein
MTYMSQFLLSVLLFLMFFPALLSLLFASRSFIIMLWNLFWFFIMGRVAVAVFQTEDAMYLGVGLTVFYLLRAFLGKKKKMVHYQIIDLGNQRPQQHDNVKTHSNPNVIDVEYKKE